MTSHSDRKPSKYSVFNDTPQEWRQLILDCHTNTRSNPEDLKAFGYKGRKEDADEDREYTQDN